MNDLWSSINIINSLITVECIEKNAFHLHSGEIFDGFFVDISHWCCVVCDCFCTVKAHLPAWWPITSTLRSPLKSNNGYKNMYFPTQGFKRIVVQLHHLFKHDDRYYITMCIFVYTLRANLLQMTSYFFLPYLEFNGVKLFIFLGWGRNSVVTFLKVMLQSWHNISI